MPVDFKNHIIIAGLPRSGSTSLYAYLLPHSEICGSSIKETQYFLSAKDKRTLAPFDTYRSYFEHHTGQKYTMEASPSYFYGGEKVAQVIYDTLGFVKLIFLLRHPAERFFSYFTHEKMFGNLPKHVVFEDFLQTSVTAAENILASGYYVNYFRHWHNIFNNHIRVVYFDDLKHNPAYVMRDLCEWMQIDADFYHSFNFTQENRGAIYKNEKLHFIARFINNRFETFFRRHPDIKRALRKVYYLSNEDQSEKPLLDNESRGYLEQYYHSYNVELYNFLSKHGYPIRGWLKSYYQEKIASLF